MRQLYKFFKKQKWSPVGTKLSISHIRLLFSINDSNEINYYAEQAEKQNLSKRQLENKIKSKEYERLPDDTKNKLINKENPAVIDFVKSPIIINKANNYIEFSEKILQGLILEDISAFLKELGSGFTFIDNEYPIKLGNRYNYIDLLLYNIKYKCYVVVELKVTELKKEHIGQIQVYMNYIDDNLKTIEENNTVGTTSEYSSSHVKKTVDAWANAKIPNGLQESRLFTTDEISSFGYEYVEEGTSKYYNKTESTPNWIYNNSYIYWTMSPFGDTTNQVWYVTESGGLYSLNTIYGRGYGYCAVRPVITLSKSVL